MKELPLLLRIHGIPEHIVYMWVAMVILIVLAIAARLTLRRGAAPTGFQNVFESIFDGVNNYIEEIMGPEGKLYFPIIATLTLVILTGNLLGLVPGCDSPTANINCTGGLAITVFFATHVIGIGRHKGSYIKHFMGPVLWLAPLMIVIEFISHLARPVSLSMRLFGNMIAKHKLLMVLALLVPYIAPIPILALGLFVAFIQTGVFVLLTMLYFAGAIEEAHGGEEHH